MTTELRALELLGQGLQQHIVAGALGVTEGRISQLLSNAEFAAAVTARRIESLQQSTKIDQKYNDLEDKTLDKLAKALPTLYKPLELVKTLQVLNQAKRRGVAADVGAVAPGVTSVSITLPNVIINQFTKNVNNQIVEVHDGQGQAKSLVTATSSAVAVLAEVRRKAASGPFVEYHEPEATQTGLSFRSQPTETSAKLPASRYITASDL